MDPNRCIQLILASTDASEASFHCDNLATWLRRGGFAPKAPAKYWPGTGTDYSILSPAYDTQDKWVFVHYDRLGNRMEQWTLTD